MMGAMERVSSRTAFTNVPRTARHPLGIGLAQSPGRLSVDIGVAGEDCSKPRFDADRKGQAFERLGHFAVGRRQHEVEQFTIGRVLTRRRE